MGVAVLAAGVELALPDVNGHTVKPVDPVKTVVFLFTRTDCPISNRYAPEIRRISDAFGPKGVMFWLVYVDPNESSSAMKHHMREYGYTFGALVDAHHQLVKITGATITPEAAVFTGGRLVYRGRIDDRYVAFGKARQSANVHDLEQVLEQVTAGKPPAFREARAVGCFIEDLK